MINDITAAELAEHILWMFAERFGLIDSVGGMEWSDRMEGTPLASQGWVDRHDDLAAALHAEPDKYASEALAAAIIHHLFDEDAAP